MCSYDAAKDKSADTPTKKHIDDAPAEPRERSIDPDTDGGSHWSAFLAQLDALASRPQAVTMLYAHGTGSSLALVGGSKP